MVNTGYKINPQIIQIFTTGPNSGSIVTSSFTVTFDSGSGFVSTSLCNQNYYNKVYEPYNCVVPSLCIPPIIYSVAVSHCTSSYNYVYQITVDAGAGSLPGLRVEYCINSGFTGEVKGTTITDYIGSVLSPVEINITNGLTDRSETSSSGLVTLPLNQYTPVYFRAYSICSGSFTSSYSNISTAVCTSLYYYNASQFTCPPTCGFVSSGWVISSPTPLIGGKYYAGNGSVFICGGATTPQTSIYISSIPYNSCGEATCKI